MRKKTETVALPEHLPPEMRAWFLYHCEEFGLDMSEQRVLEAMADTWLEMIGLRAALKAAGSYTFADRFGSPKERPELAALNRCRITFARLRRELCLPISDPNDSPRLPRQNGALN